jgi:hypothetical protein
MLAGRTLDYRNLHRDAPFFKGGNSEAKASDSDGSSAADASAAGIRPL